LERMNRTIKDATVRRFHYESHDQFRQHLADFVSAYNFGRRLKTLKGLTPYEFICKAWATVLCQSAPANAGTKHRGASISPIFIEASQISVTSKVGMRRLNGRGSLALVYAGHPPDAEPVFKLLRL